MIYIFFALDLQIHSFLYSKTSRFWSGLILACIANSEICSKLGGWDFNRRWDYTRISVLYLFFCSQLLTVFYTKWPPRAQSHFSAAVSSAEYSACSSSVK